MRMERPDGAMREQPRVAPRETDCRQTTRAVSAKDYNFEFADDLLPDVFLAVLDVNAFR